MRFLQHTIGILIELPTSVDDSNMSRKNLCLFSGLGNRFENFLRRQGALDGYRLLFQLNIEAVNTRFLV